MVVVASPRQTRLPHSQRACREPYSCCCSVWGWDTAHPLEPCCAGLSRLMLFSLHICVHPSLRKRHVP